MGRSRKHKNRNLPQGTTQPIGQVVPTLNNLTPTNHNTTGRQSRGGMVITGEMYVGPLPHPDILRQFEEIHPGSAKMIFDKFEQQSDHRRKMEELVIRGNVGQANRGQWMAFALLGTIIAGGMALAYLGKDMVGFGAIVTAVVGGVTLLLTAVVAKKRDLAGKRGEGREERSRK